MLVDEEYTPSLISYIIGKECIYTEETQTATNDNDLEVHEVCFRSAYLPFGFIPSLSVYITHILTFYGFKYISRVAANRTLCIPSYALVCINHLNDYRMSF